MEARYLTTYPQTGSPRPALRGVGSSGRFLLTLLVDGFRLTSCNFLSPRFFSTGFLVHPFPAGLEASPKTKGKAPFQNDAHTFGPCSLVSPEDFAVALGTLSDIAKDRGLTRLAVHLADARRVAMEEVR